MSDIIKGPVLATGGSPSAQNSSLASARTFDDPHDRGRNSHGLTDMPGHHLREHATSQPGTPTAHRQHLLRRPSNKAVAHTTTPTQTDAPPLRGECKTVIVAQITGLHTKASGRHHRRLLLSNAPCCLPPTGWPEIILVGAFREPQSSYKRATLMSSQLAILPVVKAYPVIDPTSQTEAVCVAGISMERPHRWIRLFPLDYRGLVMAQRFRKYEVINLEATKSKKDSRPELRACARLDQTRRVHWTR